MYMVILAPGKRIALQEVLNETNAARPYHFCSLMTPYQFRLPRACMTLRTAGQPQRLFWVY